MKDEKETSFFTEWDEVIKELFKKDKKTKSET